MLPHKKSMYVPSITLRQTASLGVMPTPLLTVSLKYDLSIKSTFLITSVGLDPVSVLSLYLSSVIFISEKAFSFILCHLMLFTLRRVDVQDPLNMILVPLYTGFAGCETDTLGGALNVQNSSVTSTLIKSTYSNIFSRIYQYK